MSSTNVCLQCSESGHTVSRCPELYHPERTSGGGGGHDHDDDDEGCSSSGQQEQEKTLIQMLD